MVETTKTAEALETATSGTGLMQSEYYKLKFNAETGQWEKEVVTEDVVPTFPGIRDVTPEYTPEGKTFKTIPIGAGPDYTPLPPVVTPTPTPPVEPPVETPTEPDTTVPTIQQPVTSEQRDEPTFVTKPKIVIGGEEKPQYTVSSNYRDKYKNLPGGFNNWSNEQVLEYAIDTGALNSMLSQNNNPYYAEPTAQKEGIMSGITDTMQAGTVGVIAKGLDATLGVRERKALVARMIKGGMLTGEVTDFVDDKGNFKVNENATLQKLFKDENTPMNGLVSATPEPTTREVERPFDDPYIVREATRIPTLNELKIPESVLTLEQAIGRDPNDTNSPFRKGSFLDKIRDKFPYRLPSTPDTELSPAETQRYNDWMKLNGDKYDPNTGKILEDYRTKVQNEGKPIKVQEIFDPQIGRYTTDPIIFAEKQRRLRSKETLTDTVPIAPRYLDTLDQAIFDTQDRFISGGISKSQPIMGTTNSHINEEKVFLDSNGGHYTSDGKYHFDSDGDGRVDAVASRGTASQAQEAANNGFIPAKTLERMTNPDGTLKSLYLQGGNYAIDSKYVKDGKYVGNVVKENRDVVDNGGNGNTVDNAAPDNSNDKKDYERDKEMEKAKEDPSDVNYTQANYEEASGTGSGSSDSSSKDKPAKIVCTEMYRQTQLDDWQRTIKLWYLFQKKYLSETHQKGYHFLFKPFVKGMQKSNMLTSIGRHFAQERTKDIKHIMYGTKFSLLGRVYRIILEPICFVVGLLLWQKK
jgi:hypothetical protein